MDSIVSLKWDYVVKQKEEYKIPLIYLTFVMGFEVTSFSYGKGGVYIRYALTTQQAICNPATLPLNRILCMFGIIKMEVIKQLNQTIENRVYIGHFFEEIFIELLKKCGFKECEDFQDLRNVGLLQSMESGLPDFYFPKVKTFVEVKSMNRSYSKVQKQTIIKLKKEGYKVKTIHFQIHIMDSLDDIKPIDQFISELKCNK